MFRGSDGQGEGDISHSWAKFVTDGRGTLGYYFYRVLGPFWFPMECDFAEPLYNRAAWKKAEETVSRYKSPKEIGLRFEKVK
jgi:hypothetical protein